MHDTMTRAVRRPTPIHPVPALIAAALMAYTPALAQDADERDAPPITPRRIGEPAPIEPSEPDISTPHPTGLTAGKDWQRALSDAIGADAPPASLREGTFIVDRPGRLVPAPNDRLIFVPDQDERLAGEGPVLLLPCAALGRMERRLIGDPRVVLSGEVFVAHARAHLMIVDFAFERAVQTPSEDEPAPDATDPDAQEPGAADDGVGIEDDPEVAALLRELGGNEPGARRRRIEALDDPRADASLATAPPTLAHGVREGTILIRRAARLDRAGDGAWRVVFDNDDPGGADALALTLLPCRLSESMEQTAIRRGPETRMLVSGRVYVHERRGYLLPTFVQYPREGDIEPWQ